MPRGGAQRPRRPPPLLPPHPQPIQEVGSGQETAAGALAALSWRGRMEPPLRAAIQRWAALVAGLLSTGEAWARRVVAALREFLAHRLSRTRTDEPALNSASLGAEVSAPAARSLPQGGLSDADTARGAPRAGADVAAARGGGRNLSLVGDAYTRTAAQERFAPDAEQTTSMADLVRAPPAGHADSAAPHAGLASNSAAPHAGLPSNSVATLWERVPILGADYAGRRNRDGAGAAAAPGANSILNIRSTDQGARRRAAPGPSAAPRTNRGGARRAVIKATQAVPFEDEGYLLDVLFRDGLEVDEVVIAYAMYCWKRSKEIRSKRFEMCDICYFKNKTGEITPIVKEQMPDHCRGIHKIEGYPCPKKGCYVRCSSLGEAGLHNLYVHEQKCKYWWKHLLERRGVKLE